MSADQIFIAIMVTVLSTAALLAVVRIVRGPSAMDRAVACEVLVSTIVCALGVEAALTRDPSTLPILISLSLVGFVPAVAVARFMSHDEFGVIDRGQVAAGAMSASEHEDGIESGSAAKEERR